MKPCARSPTKSPASWIGSRPRTRAAGRRSTTRSATGRVPARRAINNNAARRGPVEEYLITNVSGARRD
jgi:hypothetical protein